METDGALKPAWWGSHTGEAGGHGESCKKAVSSFTPEATEFPPLVRHTSVLRHFGALCLLPAHSWRASLCKTMSWARAPNHFRIMIECIYCQKKTK